MSCAEGGGCYDRGTDKEYRCEADISAIALLAIAVEAASNSPKTEIHKPQ